MDNSEMDNSQMNNNESFLNMMNVGAGDIHWDGTQDYSPIGEQVPMSNEDVSTSAKPKPTRSGSTKGRNWSVDEDKVLIKAWAETSLDAVVGTDQNSSSYWSRITEYYNTHKDPSWQVRNVASVNGRYTAISSATSKFCGCLQQILNRNQSGRTLLEKEKEAHLLYIELDLKRKPFTFMHCYLEFSKYPKWETRELEVSQKKQKKKSDASSGTTSNDEDFGASPVVLEREERPAGTKKEKERLRRGKASVSDGSACKLSLETVWAQKLEKDASKEAARDARFAQAYELQKQEVALKQFDADERVMLVDTSGMNALQRQFYEDKQKEIIACRQLHQG